VIAELDGDAAGRKWMTTDSTHIYIAMESRIARFPRLPGTGATVETLASWSASANAPQIRVDDSYAYYWAPGAHAEDLFRVPLAGGFIEALVTDCGFYALEINETDVFFSSISCLGYGSTLIKIPKTGGSATVLAPLATAVRIVADEERIYWRGSNVQGPGIYYVNVEGGEIQQLASDPSANGLMQSADEVVWFAYGTSFSGCLLGSRIQLASKADLATRTVASEVDTAWHNRQVYSRGHIYWDDCAGTLWAVNATSGEQMRMASSMGRLVLALAVDGTDVYWLTGGTQGEALMLHHAEAVP
jgi:hypothetical protein